MRIAVAGGTGLAGRHVVAAARRAGHDPVVLARSSGVDLVTGAGLDESLTGVDAVVDVSNVTTTREKVSVEFFTATTTALLAGCRRAGVGHLVALSIVGVDRVPLGYYAGKVRQEQLLRSADVPASVLRATQFHDFAGQLLARMPGPVAVVPRMRLQPVAVTEVADALVGLATTAPIPDTVPDLAGPREENLADLARRWLRARRRHRAVLEVRLPGRAGRAMAEGGNLPGPQARRGTVTFDEWLAGR